MPEVQDLDGSPVFVQPVIDVERRVKQPPHSGVLVYGCAKVREGGQQIDVGEEITGKLFGRFRVLFP